MAMVVEIPRGVWDKDQPGPCWLPSVDTNGRPCKPDIKCVCGKVSGIGLHHVHADGRVTASFFHAKEERFTHNGREYWHPPGCGWHVFLKLLDYDQGDFPPEP
jgi:hypothetical protein